MTAERGFKAEWRLVPGQIRTEFVTAGAMLVAMEGDVQLTLQNTTNATSVVREGECRVIDARGAVRLAAAGSGGVRCALMKPAGFWATVFRRWQRAGASGPQDSQDPRVARGS